MTEQKFIGDSKIIHEKIDNINDSFFSTLDDYKKHFVHFKKNPEINEYQNYYANTKSQLQNMNKKLIVTTNEIDKLINSLAKDMVGVSKRLDKEKKLNEELVLKYNSFQNTQNGSEILIDDSKKEYNIQYYKNWEMVFGIIMMGGLLGTLF